MASHNVVQTDTQSDIIRVFSIADHRIICYLLSHAILTQCFNNKPLSNAISKHEIGAIPWPLDNKSRNSVPY